MPHRRSAERMRPRVANELALLSLSAIAGSALAQNAPQRPEPQPTGSARITGRVLATDNGAPVRRAHVRLSGPPRTAQRRDEPVRPKRGRDGRQRRVYLARVCRVVVRHQRRSNQRLPRACAGETGDCWRRTSTRRGDSARADCAIVGRIADTNGEGLLGIEVVALQKNDFRRW